MAEEQQPANLEDFISKDRLPKAGDPWPFPGCILIEPPKLVRNTDGGCSMEFVYVEYIGSPDDDVQPDHIAEATP